MSPDSHFDPSVLSAYVEGRLAIADEQAVEGHVERCTPCARALQIAAAREEELFAVAAALERAPRAKHAWRPTLSVGAMAAGVLLMLSGDAGSHHPDSRLSLDHAFVQRGHSLRPVRALPAMESTWESPMLASFPEDTQEEVLETNVCIVGDEELMCTLDERI